jgi:signal transduction histidine kinase
VRRVRFPRPTVRLRLTLLYGGLFLVGGAVLLTLNYFLVRRSISVQPDVLQERIELRLGRSLFSFQAPQSVDDEHLRQLLQQAASELRAEALHELIIQSLTALGAMAVVSVGVGWLVAGRVLRPLKKITVAARRLSEETLHERIDLQGAEDELKVLADTFDEMLDRLDAAFDSQRRFVANASHELRTPLSIIPAELDVTLSNPHPTLEEFVAMADVVRQATDRSERLIDSLLMLARGKSVNLDHQIVDLGPLASEVVANLEREAFTSSIRVEIAFDRAEVRGDQVLLERLIQNLLENAIRYNRPGAGWRSRPGRRRVWFGSQFAIAEQRSARTSWIPCSSPFGASGRTASGRAVGSGWASPSSGPSRRLTAAPSPPPRSTKVGWRSS